MVTITEGQVREPWLVVIAASAGGIQALTNVLSTLPKTLPASIVIVQHRTPRPESGLEQILARTTRMPVTTARLGEPVEPGVVYIARPDLHLRVGSSRCFGYANGTRIRGVLSSANPLFESAADVYKDRTIGVVLTGSGFDATDGVQRVKARGGIVIVQDPASAQYNGMPSAAIGSGAVDRVLPLDAIAPALIDIITGRVTDGTPVFP